MFRALEGLKKRFEAAGRGLAIGGAAGVAAGTAALTPLLAAGKAALDRNTQIAGLAGKLGVTTEDLSALAYAAEQTGQNFEDLRGHFENFSERIGQAANGTGEGAETFRKLNLNASELVKIPITEAMEKVLVSLEGVTDQTAKLAMMSTLGGDKFQELALLAKEGAGGIAALKREAKDVGAVLSGADAKESVAVARSLNAAYTAAKSTFLALGTAVLPSADAMQAFQRAVIGGASQVRAFVEANRGVIQVVGLTAAALVAGGTALIGVGATLAAVGFAVGALKTVVVGAFALIASPIALTVVAVGALGYAFFTLSETGRQAWAELGGVFASVGDRAQAAFRAIGDALKTGDMKLAMKVAGESLNVEWLKITSAVQDTWDDLTFHLVDGWQSAMYLIQSNFAAMLTSLKASANEASGTLAKAFVGAAAKYPGATDSLARGLVGDSFADDLKTLARDENAAKDTIDNITEAKARANAKQGQDEQNRLSKEFGDKQAAAKALRDQDVRGRQDALAAAEAEARQARITAAFRAAFGGKPAADPLRDLPTAAQVGKATRGAFGFSDAQQVFSGGDRGVIDEMKRQTALLAQIKKELESKQNNSRTLVDINTVNTTNNGAAVRFA